MPARTKGNLTVHLPALIQPKTLRGNRLPTSIPCRPSTSHKAQHLEHCPTLYNTQKNPRSGVTTQRRNTPPSQRQQANPSPYHTTCVRGKKATIFSFFSCGRCCFSGGHVWMHRWYAMYNMSPRAVCWSLQVALRGYYVPILLFAGPCASWNRSSSSAVRNEIPT